MLVSLYNGVSGVKTSSFGTDVVSNNIANVNTTGFIGSTPEFKTTFYQSLSAAGYDPVNSRVGLGVSAMATSLNTYEYGPLQSTEGEFDMAIVGIGYFGVKNAQTGEVLYTRNGDFIKDANGDIVNSSGFYLTGSTISFSPTTLSQNALQKLESLSNKEVYTFDTNTEPVLTTPEAQDKIHLPENLFISGTATQNVSFKGYLNSTSENKYVSVDLDSASLNSDLSGNLLNISGDLDDMNLSGSYKEGDIVNFTITDINGDKISRQVAVKDDGTFNLNNLDVSNLDLSADLEVNAVANVKQDIPNKESFLTEVFAPDGTKNRLQINFKQVLPTSSYASVWEAEATLTDFNGNTVSSTNGELVFNEHGALVSNTLGSIDNGGVALNMDFGSFYDGTSNHGFDGVSLSGTQSGATDIQSDGKADGIFLKYFADDNGNVVASFDNGTTYKVAKIALYHFQNAQGLQKVSETSFRTSANSGQPLFFRDENGNVTYGTSGIKGKYLEMSNVDLSNEFANLIIMEKAYSASAKSITTSNEILQTLINLKR